MTMLPAELVLTTYEYTTAGAPRADPILEVYRRSDAPRVSIGEGVSTTKVRERTRRVYPRRTQSMQVFQNAKSAQRIYEGVTFYLSQNLGGAPRMAKFHKTPPVTTPYDRNCHTPSQVCQITQ